MKMNGGRIPVLPFKKNKKFHLAIRIEFKSIQKEIKSKVIISNKIKKILFTIFKNSNIILISILNIVLTPVKIVYSCRLGRAYSCFFI